MAHESRYPGSQISSGFANAGNADSHPRCVEPAEAVVEQTTTVILSRNPTDARQARIRDKSSAAHLVDGSDLHVSYPMGYDTHK